MNELDIFSAAMELTSSEERGAYLDKACGDNAELRHRIEELIRSHNQVGNFMDSPARGFAGTQSMHSMAELAGAMIGPYKLLQEIGEGGMGVVYMAEQTEPVERRVALKIIKPGMDSRQVIARFEAERQALAMMDHPNIAKVLEAGTTDSGRPYFVMELVKGIPIVKYCDEHRLTPRERLELFMPVCRAVQHAHQKGIIHRDLKSSNVLVAEYDHERMPKIIDFGVAKALGQKLTEKTMFTQFGQIVGTLEYMSPEQAKLNQLDIDTRSDIYSLGVLLYELLAGSTPFDPQRLRSSGFEEIMRIIREEDPPKPSTRLRTSATLPSVAADRQTEPNKLPGLISGELDWIVMKALEKHRERRYETAGGFAEDIQRYLNDEPVVACPPSAGYRIRKFARKHYAAVAVSAALFTILLAAAMVSTWEAMKATKAERRAQEALAEARAAQETEAEARLEAETERNRASQAESLANQERDNARQAEQRANADRARAIVSHERAQDALAASLFEQACALRLSGEPGRRWHATELLQQAEQLRGRQRPAIPDAAAEPDESAITEETPNRSRLRTEAVAALSLRDGRVLRQRSTDDVETASLPVVYALSPEGQFAVSVSHRLGQRTCDLAVVDLESGREVARWEGLDQMAFSGSGLALGPGGKRLAAPSTSSQYITVWEVTDKRQIRKLRVWTKPGEARSPSKSAILPGTIDRMVFSPDGRYLAAVLASTPKWHVFLWDLEDADAAPVIHSGDSLPAAMVVFSPDSRLLAFRTDVHKVTVWDSADRQVETEIRLPLELNGSLGFSRDGRLLGIHGMEADESQERGPRFRGAIVLWDVTEDRQHRRLDTRPSVSKAQVAFSSDGRRVAVAGVDGEIQVLDLDGEQPSVTLHHGAAPQLLAWEPAGEYLISAGIGSLNVWEFSEPPHLSIAQFEPDAFPGPMGPFSYSPDERWVVVEKPFVRAPDLKGKLQTGGLVVFERDTGKLVRTLQYDASAVYRLLFSRDGQKLVRLAPSGLVVWDLESGNENMRMKAGPGTGRELISAGFREDDTLLVGGHTDYQPTVWEADTADVVWQGSKQPDAAGMAVISPDARFVVGFEAYGTGSENTARVFDLSTGEQRFQLDTPPAKDHQCRVTVSPDARRILTLCQKGPVTRGLQPWTGQQAWSLAPVEQTWTGSVWDAETGKRQLEMHGVSTVATYAFSPDGRYLAIGEANGTVRFWSLEHREELFGWRAWGERAKAPLMYSHLEFTPDSSALAVADPSSSALHLLEVTRLEAQLAEIGLDW